MSPESLFYLARDGEIQINSYQSGGAPRAKASGGRGGWGGIGVRKRGKKGKGRSVGGLMR